MPACARSATSCQRRAIEVRIAAGPAGNRPAPAALIGGSRRSGGRGYALGPTALSGYIKRDGRQRLTGRDTRWTNREHDQPTRGPHDCHAVAGGEVMKFMQQEGVDPAVGGLRERAAWRLQRVQVRPPDRGSGG